MTRANAAPTRAAKDATFLMAELAAVPPVEAAPAGEDPRAAVPITTLAVFMSNSMIVGPARTDASATEGPEVRTTSGKEKR